MAKALWFLLKPALLMVGTLTLIYPVLVLLCLVTGWNNFIFTYVQGFFMLFDIIIGICAAQAASAYAPLALSFGVTRRSLRRAMAAFFVLLPLLCLVLDYLCNNITTRLFYAEVNPIFVSLAQYPLQGLGLKLILCGTMLWMGTMDFATMPIWKRVLVIAVLCVAYLQVAVFMLLGSFLSHALSLYSLVLILLSLPFAGLALHQIRRLAITQV